MRGPSFRPIGEKLEFLWRKTPIEGNIYAYRRKKSKNGVGEFTPLQLLNTRRHFLSIIIFGVNNHVTITNYLVICHEDGHTAQHSRTAVM